MAVLHPTRGPIKYVAIGLKGTVDQGSVAEILRDGRPRIDGTAVDWPDVPMYATSWPPCTASPARTARRLQWP